MFKQTGLENTDPDKTSPYPQEKLPLFWDPCAFASWCVWKAFLTDQTLKLKTIMGSLQCFLLLTPAAATIHHLRSIPSPTAPQCLLSPPRPFRDKWSLLYFTIRFSCTSPWHAQHCTLFLHPSLSAPHTNQKQLLFHCHKITRCQIHWGKL